MNYKLRTILRVFFCSIAVGLALTLNIFGETLNSNIFTAEQKNNFTDFEGKSISTTANLNWLTENGEKITKTTVKHLPSYMLSVNISGETREKATFISAPAKALDMSGVGRVYFVMEYSVEDDKAEYTVNFTLGDGTDKLISTAPMKGNTRQLVSFEVGFFAGTRSITELSLEFLSDHDADGKILISGPYYVETDLTYAEDFCLGDATLSLEAKYTEQGIFIEDSTQKTGFSGRFLRPFDGNVNYLRFFITTGAEGGTMEMRYSYLSDVNGSLATKSTFVELEDGEENCTYMVPLEYVDRIISFSFLFDVARSGGITVHRIEAVEIYPSDNRELYGEISECTYASGEGIISIKGKIYHSFLIKHTDYKLYCYRLDVSETLAQVLDAGEKPIASTKMSSELKMTYKAGRQDKLAAVSKYALVASNGEEYIELLPPFHVDTESNKTSKDKSSIKGIYGSTDTVGMGADVSVVDVYLDRLTGEKKSGYIYSLGDNHVYFDSDYLSSIDDRVKNLCASGCSVYLRLLVSADGTGISLPYVSQKENDTALYSAIEVGNETAKAHLFSVVDFLTTRYSERADGKIEGYIIGKAVNLPTKYNSGTVDGFSDYTDSFADTVEIIALSARVSMPSAKIIVPIAVDGAEEGGYDAELFLTSLCNRLDVFGGLDFTVMLESSRLYFPEGSVSMSTFPFVFDKEGKIARDETLVITSNATAENVEFVEHITQIERMLTRLRKTSDSAQSGYIYFWEPVMSERRGNVVSAYIYTYYTLLFSDRAESFIISTAETDDAALLQLVRYIDTPRNKNGELVNFVLSIFNAASWEEIIPAYNGEELKSRIYTETSNSAEITATGKFALFDFSSSFGTLGWFAGNDCRSLSLTSESGEKFLLAQMTGDGAGSELTYYFDYPEKLSFAPYLDFYFSVGENPEEKYSVKITVRSGKDILEATDIFSGGGKCNFLADIGSIASKSGIDSVTVCIKRADGASEDFELRLYSVWALSKTLNDDQLAQTVASSRSEAKNPSAQTQTGGEQAKPDYEFAFILLAVLVVCVIVAGIYDRNKEK